MKQLLIKYYNIYILKTVNNYDEVGSGLTNNYL